MSSGATLTAARRRRASTQRYAWASPPKTRLRWSWASSPACGCTATPTCRTRCAPALRPVQPPPATSARRCTLGRVRPGRRAGQHALLPGRAPKGARPRRLSRPAQRHPAGARTARVGAWTIARAGAAEAEGRAPRTGVGCAGRVGGGGGARGGVAGERRRPVQRLDAHARVRGAGARHLRGAQEPLLALAPLPRAHPGRPPRLRSPPPRCVEAHAAPRPPPAARLTPCASGGAAGEHDLEHTTAEELAALMGFAAYAPGAPAGQRYHCIDSRAGWRLLFLDTLDVRCAPPCAPLAPLLRPP